MVGGSAVRCEQGENFGFWEVEAKGFESDLEFVVIDSLIFV